MSALQTILATLPTIDWLALASFFAVWWGYTEFSKRRALTHPSILGLTNRIRHRWMLQTTYRDVRVIDGPVFLNLSTSVSFFASTTILIIGGLLAVLGTTEKAVELVREIPFAARTSALVFDLKLVLLLVIFISAFFRFTWAIRQYSFGALLVAAAPEASQFDEQQLDRRAFARKAGTIVAMAAQTFNHGLRAYYFAFAALAWFFSPVIFLAATVMVAWVLYQREFNSDVLAVLGQEDAAASDSLDTVPAMPPRA